MLAQYTHIEDLVSTHDQPSRSIGSPRASEDHPDMNTATTAASPADPELITLGAFLRRFSLSKSTFYRLASRGEAPDVLKLGRATYVPLAAARAWLQSRTVPAATLSRPLKPC